jgi:hypothetical protein
LYINLLLGTGPERVYWLLLTIWWVFDWYWTGVLATRSSVLLSSLNGRHLVFSGLPVKCPTDG